VTVSLTVNAVNDAPTANDDTGTADEDSPLIVGSVPGVTANDTDIDGPGLSVTGVGDGGTIGTPFALPSGALLTLNADGSYVYNPNGKFEALRPMQIGSDSFTYTISDGAGGSDTATVTITINGANEVPVAAADVYNGVTGNTPYAVSAAAGLLANDSDPDQPPSGLSVTHVNGVDVTTGPISVTGGTVTVAADGGFVFTPTTGFTGAASFTYTLSDADGGTDTATATLNVTDPVWYVNAATGSDVTGDGSYAKPFASLAPLNTGGSADGLDNADDTIFVYNAAGGGTLTGGITLETGQKLFGDGHEFTVNGIQIGAAGVVAGPTINHATYGVTLSSGNEVRGLNFNGTAAGAVAIQDGGGTVGVLTVANVAVSGQGQIADIDAGGTLNVVLTSAASSGSSGANGGVIDLSGVGGSFTVSGGGLSITGTHGQTGVDLTGNTGLTASFIGAAAINTGAQAAVNLGASTSSTTSFTGGLDIDTTGGTGLASAAGNTLVIAGPGGATINTTTGQILNLADTVIGASGVTFATLAASNTVANTAISLNNVDGAAFNGGTVTVAGTSGAGSDGIRIDGGSTAAFSFASATINNTGGDGIELNGANGAVTLSTVSIDNAAGHGLSIVGATNAVTVNGGAIGAVNDPGGDAVNITGGSGAVTIAAALSKSTAGHVVEVNGHTAGAVAFSGDITATLTASANNGILVNASGGAVAFTGQSVALNTGVNAAVSLTGNTGAISFAPAGGGQGLDIVTTSGAGFTATGGGTVTVTGAGNTIASGTGTALNVNGTTIGAGGLTFQSINTTAVSANPGIILTSTGSTAGLTVTGTGGAGSGGTIGNKTGNGITLANASSVSLTSVLITNNDGSGVSATDTTGFTLSNTSVTNNGDTLTGAEANLFFVNVLGSYTISNSTISGGFEDQIRITPVSGVGVLTITGSTIDGAGGAGNGLTVANSGDVNTSNFTLNLSGSTVKNVTSSGILINGNGDASRTINVLNSTFQDNNSGVHLLGSFNTDLTFNIDGSTFLRHGLNPIQIVSGTTTTSAAQWNGRINNNQIGDGSPDSGAHDLYGIAVELNGDVQSIISITSNNIRNTDIEGIFVQTRLDDDGDGQTGSLNLTIRGNVLGTPDDNSAFPFGFVYGMRVEARNTTSITLDMANNQASGIGGAEDIRLRQRDTATFRLERLTDGDGTPNEVITNMATVEARIISDNPGNTADATQQTVSTGFTEAANGATLEPPSPSQAFALPSRAPTGRPGLNGSDFAPLVAAAIARWAEAGATDAQLAAMRAVSVSVSDLGGLQIGQSTVGAIVIDDNAGGWGWFVDPTPGDDAEFSGSGAALEAVAGGGADGRIDLLTVILHELGHQAGLDDHYADADAGLMYGFLDVGERHLPELDHVEAMAAAPAAPTAGLTGWISGAKPETGEPAPAGSPEAAGVEGWIDGWVLEADTGGLDALLSGYAPSTADGGAWDAGAVVPDPWNLPPPPFEPVHPVM
jgi:hypothetical protein